MFNALLDPGVRLFIALVLLVIACAYRVWSRSAERKLRARVQRLHDKRDELATECELLREEAVDNRERLEAALLDLNRAERKLSRVRTSRARHQAAAADWQRLYRNEFKRADQAEVRLMRWQYDRKYDAQNPDPPKARPIALRPEQALALADGRDAKGLTSP
jgi:hypothetical protein